MAVPPNFAGHKMCFSAPGQPSPAGVPTTKHTLELFLDYCCPFSGKMYTTLFNTIIPMIRSKPSYSAGIELVFRQQIQPWHPQSALMHEAALAVLQINPEKFWNYSAELFKHQKEYFDTEVVNETRNETYKRLVNLASDTCGIDAGKMMDLLVVSDEPTSDGTMNGGNKVTNDVKMITKMSRLVGIHVTPSVIFDGVPYPAISSGWGKDEWEGFLKERCSV
ncbi:hypothetical protein MKZ38_008218 [Zalerion maritima]|uniref:Thioredoxin-like fold domain-containing protein n=1 Tax=Zalerion maritima TaxID=339359 RepID=A0AAD5RHS5_9PEZI|nr:hypothetical protein MKZ38_008218 [Zalerion maritima]